MPSDPKRPWYRVAEVVLTPILRAALRHRWRGQENLPLSGGVIVVANHISKIDPLTFGYFVNSAGRVPRYLAKASLFEHRWLGRVFIGTDMIPVQRGGEGAASSVQAAVDAVRGGSCVVVYPEATITRDPGLWPMVGKTGAARIALVTGAPVIPVAQYHRPMTCATTNASGGKRASPRSIDRAGGGGATSDQFGTSWRAADEVQGLDAREQRPIATPTSSVVGFVRNASLLLPSLHRDCLVFPPPSRSCQPGWARGCQSAARSSRTMGEIVSLAQCRAWRDVSVRLAVASGGWT